MNYTVIWTGPALQELAAAWIVADDRNSVTEASERIDRAIQLDPLGTGESREGNQRIVIDLPLIVVYEVFQDRQQAHVITCGLSRRRPRS